MKKQSLEVPGRNLLLQLWRHNARNECGYYVSV